MSSQADLIESSKKAAAYLAVKEHLEPSFRHIGIGSGSTVVYIVEAIAALGADATRDMIFYPTGDQSRALIEDANLRLASISQLPLNSRLDVCFDGADEVDENLNLIKGGGACLFQEKIVATASKKFICVADYRKLSPRLGTTWKQGIPIEVLPLAAKRVLSELVLIGAQLPVIRQGVPRKAGPVVTDNSMWLIDAPFQPLQLSRDPNETRADGEGGVWTVDGLADRLIKIPGIVETGLFAGFNGLETKAVSGGAQKPIAAYFGMADGSVQVRKA
ncbi:ribose 5-phosphate isomerase A [Sporothrix brasiliensis 5110]|uniref:Ribose-5-phosphate isomerase n=1 Tax=Sporothrix brasiliensis 5110 TaxID=1398154 RepID=A0A0C2F0F5_9PEZI|nr:ribose 5-phosphate isomerase A [Sporothrix brasiliensis 5110]KIH92274.1 ribose 5-phosphate isomerase A [Sporothrix brasiliensis 5110]